MGKYHYINMICHKEGLILAIRIKIKWIRLLERNLKIIRKVINYIILCLSHHRKVFLGIRLKIVHYIYKGEIHLQVLIKVVACTVRPASTSNRSPNKKGRSVCMHRRCRWGKLSREGRQERINRRTDSNRIQDTNWWWIQGGRWQTRRTTRRRWRPWRRLR